jgi:hypothetical protein
MYDLSILRIFDISIPKDNIDSLSFFNTIFEEAFTILRDKKFNKISIERGFNIFIECIAF